MKSEVSVMTMLLFIVLGGMLFWYRIPILEYAIKLDMLGSLLTWAKSFKT